MGEGQGIQHKLGNWEDISHESTDVLAESDYGKVACYMKRPIPTEGTSEQEEE